MSTPYTAKCKHALISFTINELVSQDPGYVSSSTGLILIIIIIVVKCKFIVLMAGFFTVG